MAPGDRPTVVLAGALAHRPGRGGHAWVFLQWLLGFRRLGFDPLFVDRLDAAVVGPDPGDRCRAAVGRRWVHEVLAPFGLADAVVLLGDDGTVLLGPDRTELLARVRDAVALFDVMGFCADEDLLAAAPVRVGFDIDPGFGQLWAEDGLADPFAGHDRFLTVGLNLGGADCGVPTGGRRWVRTPPPVVLEHWPDRGPGTGPVTSVGSWRGPWGPLERNGTRLGLRVHAARPFVDLPARTGARFSVAWEFDDADAADRAEFSAHGWDLCDPARVVATPGSYAAFIAASGAELCIAKELYVRLRTGWFSDRSAAYLASGRPVVMTDTGLAGHLPTGDGLLLVDDVDDAVAAVTELVADPGHHSAAARSLAEEHLDSDRVIARALHALELT